MVEARSAEDIGDDALEFLAGQGPVRRASGFLGESGVGVEVLAATDSLLEKH
ncbi:hypothetical protein [Rhizorhabdus histidinilytica]|uniref:hypothetical protein n=1 Tax=Rhizorhabdus histidinilytica TaxID=439228 RepID=UPI0016804244